MLEKIKNPRSLESQLASSRLRVPGKHKNPQQRESEKTTPAPSGVNCCYPYPKGLNPLPHQFVALDWSRTALEENRPSYLGLDPGLGKTIIAAILSVYFKARVFYVCPPFLVTNTKEEFKKWGFKPNLFMLPDSLIHKHLEYVKENITPNSILFVDEADRFKNLSARRTKTVLKSIYPLFNGRVVFMSGTPLPNSRPIEIWPILRTAVPKIFGYDFFPFALKYCGAFKTDFGWNFSGFTNRKEFKARLEKSFMLRMKKKDVLDLPPKIEGLLTVGDGETPREIASIEKKILAKYKESDIVTGEIKEFFGVGGDELHLATYLRMLGSYKVKYVIPFIQSLLENGKENLLVFAVHKGTIATLTKALEEWKPLVITGAVAKEKRQGLVKQFQTDKQRRLFIGNIKACGVGFTLTKATRVLFVEFSWVDGENTQASDRAHRIGQTESVLVQYVVLNGSLDHKRMEVLLKKRSLSI